MKYVFPIGGSKAHPSLLLLALGACNLTSDTGKLDEDWESATSDCDQVANFPALTANAANSAWADPEVEVRCTEDAVLVQSNGIPAYEYVATTPNALTEADILVSFPRYPEVAAQPSEIPLLGTAGMAVNGLPIFGPNEAAQPDPYGDPVYNGIVDQCLGHTGQGGAYHYHAVLVECVLQGLAADTTGAVVGYALDGFPILSPMECVDSDCAEVIEMQSSWEQSGDPSTYAWDNNEYVEKDGAQWLDECNGHVGPDGDYHYHATEGFPYLLGCYAGTPSDDAGLDDDGGDQGADQGGGQGGAPPSCDDVGQGEPCCGDDMCDGPETADNCAADCG